jgi:hypothetical protein
MLAIIEWRKKSARRQLCLKPTHRQEYRGSLLETKRIRSGEAGLLTIYQNKLKVYGLVCIQGK